MGHYGASFYETSHECLTIELIELVNYLDSFAAVYHFMFLQITFDVRMPIRTHCMRKAIRRCVLEWVIMVHHFMRLHMNVSPHTWQEYGFSAV